MTDARIPERFLADRRVLRLTPEARSSYFMATLWSVSNRTDGHFDRADIEFIPTFASAAIDELVHCGLWEPNGDGWQDTEFARTQSTRDALDHLERIRKAEREKKARQRAHAAGLHDLCSAACGHTGRPGDTSRGQSPGTAQDRDRTGESSATNIPDAANTHRSANQSVQLSLRENWTPAPSVQAAAARLGLTLKGAQGFTADVLRHAGEAITADRAVDLAAAILARAAGPVANPAGYLRTVARESPDVIRAELAAPIVDEAAWQRALTERPPRLVEVTALERTQIDRAVRGQGSVPERLQAALKEAHAERESQTA
ncbi:MAG: hypothetical protein ACQEW8_04465 [Actinomycetota bacterium]